MKRYLEVGKLWHVSYSPRNPVAKRKHNLADYLKYRRQLLYIPVQAVSFPADLICRKDGILQEKYIYIVKIEV